MIQAQQGDFIGIHYKSTDPFASLRQLHMTKDPWEGNVFVVGLLLVVDKNNGYKYMTFLKDTYI